MHLQTTTPAALAMQAFNQSEQTKKTVNRWMWAAFFTVLAILSISAAEAQSPNADGGFIDIPILEELWDFFSGLVTGMLGKILALLALVAAFWSGFEQNWRGAAGAGLLCLALAFGPGIIDNLFSAGIVL